MTTNNAVDVTLSGQTGTGTFVGATSPTFITPNLGVATATSLTFGGTALSNYVQGNFTPTYVGSGGGSATYSTQFGSYTQIGNRVFFEISLTITASTLIGNIGISGLPSTPAIVAAASVWATGFTAAAATSIMVLINTTAPTLDLYVYATGTATPLTATQLNTASTVVVSGCYHV